MSDRFGEWRDGDEKSLDWLIIRDVKGALICLDAGCRKLMISNLGGNGYVHFTHLQVDMVKIKDFFVPYNKGPDQLEQE